MVRNRSSNPCLNCGRDERQQVMPAQGASISRQAMSRPERSNLDWVFPATMVRA